MLDVYPKRPYRICKDNNGGYGTANDYGDGIVAKLLSYAVARTIDFPPLHAVYTLGQLAKAGHEVAYSRSYDGQKHDLCVIPSSIVAHETELQAVRTVSSANIPVLVTGPFSSAVPEPYIQAGGKVVFGEPEMFFHEFSMAVEEVLALPPKCKSTQQIELDELAYPAWDMVLKDTPTKMGFIGGSGATIPIIATRGCPYSCFHYCTYPAQQGRKLRSRDPDAVVAEMTHWQETLGVSNFIFRDPVFSINRKYVESLCQALEQSGKDFKFGVELHLKDIDEALANRLFKAGLRLVYAGIESVTTEVLHNVKRQTIEKDEQARKVRMLEDAGIRVKTMYIFGFPNDTKETIQASLEYARKLCSSYGQFSVFTPYPGTPVYEEYTDKIAVKQFEDFTQWRLVFDHPSLTNQEIRELLNTAYHRYYTNPRWVLKTLRSMVTG